jgi:hypothetical protein
VLGKLSIIGAVAAIIMISTAPSAQVGGAVSPGVHVGGAVNAGAAVRGAITPGVLGASGASNTASATTSGINGSYSTTFPLTENPISEGGSWTNGGATGLGWANVQTTPGLSFGTGPVNAGTYLYADPTAVLQGAWAQDQQVQATVKVPGVYGRACCKEVELRIRTTITGNSITGYELNCSVVPAGPYLTLVRWNGPLNNFTYIVRNATPCVNGDVLKLTAVGNTFTIYKNGVQVLQGTDATFQKGSPGVGFYDSVDNNWSGFGLSNFSASNVGSIDKK